jgi:uncharacterized protein (TIGR03083 family)
MDGDRAGSGGTTERVLGEIRGAREAIEALLGRLDEAALTRPGPDGGWSIKDHLAHLTAWRRMVLGLLEGQPRHTALGVDRATYDRGEDAINAALEARAKSQPLDAVVAEFRQVYDDLAGRLAHYDEATWNEPFPLNPRPEYPRVDNIAGNTYEHDHEHLEWIEAALVKRASSPEG